MGEMTTSSVKNVRLLLGLQGLHPRRSHNTECGREGQFPERRLPGRLGLSRYTARPAAFTRSPS